MVYGAMSSLDLASPKETMPKAKAALQKAMQLDEHLAEVHALTAMIAIIHTKRDEKEKAVQILDELVELRKQSYASSWCMAISSVQRVIGADEAWKLMKILVWI
jgi:predicted negative regulator of RcsB-dependent stress response